MHGHAVDEDQAGSMRIELMNGQVQGNLVIINDIMRGDHGSLLIAELWFAGSLNGVD